MKKKRVSLESAEAVTHIGLLKNKRNQRGITLIALIVTIVILLILAGITIMYTVGDNGILKAAKEAKNQTEAAIRK
jgi:type II secretory pathway pseudopilin PulG